MLYILLFISLSFSFSFFISVFLSLLFLAIINLRHWFLLFLIKFFLHIHRFLYHFLHFFVNYLLLTLPIIEKIYIFSIETKALSFGVDQMLDFLVTVLSNWCSYLQIDILIAHIVWIITLGCKFQDLAKNKPTIFSKLLYNIFLFLG